MQPFIIAVLLGLFVRFYWGYRILKVSGNSMQPTYQNGEILLGMTARKIRRFDLIVFKRDKKLYIKRVIALPGEQVEIQEHYVLINQLALVEPYLKKEYQPTFKKIKKVDVPSHHYYVLGDNRKSSVDSRRFGPIDKNQVLAKVCRRIK